MEKLREHIRKVFDRLTAGQKEVAMLLLKEPSLFALHSAKEIGARTKTSETTVFRFSVAVGFSGYSAMQEEIRRALLHEREGSNPLGEWGASSEYPADMVAFMHEFAQRDSRHMMKTISELNPEALAKAVESVRSASNIVVIGLRASYAPAHWLTYTLNIIRGNAVLYHGGMDDANSLLAGMKEGCLVIALSFPRYMKETYEFVREAKQRSAQMIAITDHELSPIARLSDVLLKVVSPQPVTLMGMSVVFALLNMLTNLVSARDKERVQERISHYNSIAEQAFYFVEERDVNNRRVGNKEEH